MNQVLDPVDVKELLKERVDYHKKLYGGHLTSKLYVSHLHDTSWLMYALFDRRRPVARRTKQEAKDIVQGAGGGSLVELPEYEVHEPGECEECSARFEQELRS